MIVALIGYRGTGKSTIGHLLADRLGWSVVDTDALVQDRVGKSIRQIFADDGEEAFRDAESTVLAEVVRRHQTVVSLGGGAVLRESNRRLLAIAGPVVWLTASPETLRRRLTRDAQTSGSRPPLIKPAAGGAASVLDEIEQVLAMRIPIYRACATLEVATDDRRPSQIVETILDALDLSPSSGLS